jgi:hypothetical protein
MNWLYTEFKPYCQRFGIHLAKKDLLLIEKRLAKIPKDAHKRVMREYVKIWLDTVGRDENVRLAKDLGLRAANKWLRGMSGDER